MKKILLGISLLLVLLVVVLAVNTLRFSSKQINAAPASLPAINEAVVQKLAESVRIQNISYDDTSTRDHAAFKKMDQFLIDHYPLCEANLQKETVGDYSLLYTWKGSNPKLKPALLMAHLDVVPFENEKNWEKPPFSGLVEDGMIWGRGTLDDKCSVLGILEAVELLLQEKFNPQRTTYLAFGYDEEVYGSGAAQIAALLKQRGIQLDFVLDEGLVITQGMMPGIDDPIALIGISEKGFANIELSVQSAGGHSSMPPKETAIGILSNAVAAVEANPMPQKIGGPVKMMFDYAGPEMGFPLKTVIANRWLFGSILKSQLANGASTNATTRTTTAPTMLQGSKKANVLPSEAKAVINFRILPGETTADVLAHVKNAVADKRVQVQAVGAPSEPAPIASIESEAYEAIATTIRQVFENVAVAPALTVATTDSRKYVAIADNVYRFLPVTLTSEDLSRIHGANERISVAAYKKVIQYYYQLIKNVN